MITSVGSQIHIYRIHKEVEEKKWEKKGKGGGVLKWVVLWSLFGKTKEENKAGSVT